MMNLKNYILEAKWKFLGRVVAQFFKIRGIPQAFCDDVEWY